MKAKKYKILLIIVLSLILGAVDFSQANTIYTSAITDIPCFCDSYINYGFANIDDVYIDPSEPAFNNPITIHSNGRGNTGPVTIDNTYFYIDGNNLQLDIYISLGPFLAVTPWSHAEDIGTLPIGAYDLTVRAFVDSNMTDNYAVSFEVIPEPATFILLAAGVVGVRIRRQKFFS